MKIVEIQEQMKLNSLEPGDYVAYFYKKGVVSRKYPIEVNVKEINQPIAPVQGFAIVDIDRLINKEKEVKQNEATVILEEKLNSLNRQLESHKTLLKDETEKHKMFIKNNKDTQQNLNHQIYVTKQALKTTKQYE